MTTPHAPGRAILFGVLLSFVCLFLLLIATAIFGSQVQFERTKELLPLLASIIVSGFLTYYLTKSTRLGKASTFPTL